MIKIRLETDHPLATESLDYLHPLGSKGNNIAKAFVDRILSLYADPPSLLDLGCAGGGVVRLMIEAGSPMAYGLDGTADPLTSERSDWGLNPDNYFTCDITKPFSLKLANDPTVTMCFHVVTCCEVFEHIHEYDVKHVFENINRHTVFHPSTGVNPLCIFTISNDSSWSDGVDLHITKRDRVWWLDIFQQLGWRPSELQEKFVEPDDWCGWVGPSTMHFVLERDI
jgi:hypothetical protein